MTILLLLCVLTGAPRTAPLVPTDSASTIVVDDQKAEYEAKKKEAGKDPEKLWELYLWCDAYGMEKEGRKALRSLLRVDKEHKQAHELLGHLFYDGKWFTSEKKLAKYQLAEEKRKAEEEGLVKWKGEWVPIDDLPKLKKGLVKDESGKWIDELELRRVAEGWRMQDTEWIEPADFDKLEQGLWKCGDEWKNLEDANKYHASTDYPWMIPTDHFLLFTTCNREQAEEITTMIERAYRNLARIFGGAPPDPAPIMIFNSRAQYSSFASGNEMIGRQGTDARGLSSVHRAYLADAWIRDDTFMGAGIGYWDENEEKGAFAPYSIRHAAGLSIAEAMDKSPEARAKIDTKGLKDRYLQDFWDEKRIPEWFRIGSASYVERYYLDSLVKAGGDPEWVKKWSVENLISKGGLRPVEDVFETPFRFDDFDGTAKLINECGLVMAFIIDGKCTPVIEAHGRVKQALRQNKDYEDAFEALSKAIIANETELRKFGGV